MSESELLKMFVLALAVSTVAVTTTKSHLFNPFHSWAYSRSAFLGDMTSCPYCFSHWLSFAAALVFAPRPIDHVFWSNSPEILWAINFVVASFALVSMAAWFSAILMRVYSKSLVH